MEFCNRECPQWHRCHCDPLCLCTVATGNRFYLSVAGLSLSAANFHATLCICAQFNRTLVDQQSNNLPRVCLQATFCAVTFKMGRFGALVWLRAVMLLSVTGGTVLLWTQGRTCFLDKSGTTKQSQSSKSKFNPVFALSWNRPCADAVSIRSPTPTPRCAPLSSRASCVWGRGLSEKRWWWCPC